MSSCRDVTNWMAIFLLNAVIVEIKLLSPDMLSIENLLGLCSVESNTHRLDVSDMVVQYQHVDVKRFQSVVIGVEKHVGGADRCVTRIVHLEQRVACLVGGEDESVHGRTFAAVYLLTSEEILY